MTHHTLNASVPEHLYGFVQDDIMQGLNGATTLTPCVIFGITSIPSRALHFSILCETGAQWARIPLHKLFWEKPKIKIHDITDLQLWDCHGWDFSVTAYEYLREMSCEFLNSNGKPVSASYWFTLDHTDNGYSQYPPEHKCYHILLLEDGSGQIAAMPNNRILWKDDSFVKRNMDEIKKFRTMPPVSWHAETSRNPQDTAFTKDSE